jgi:sortase (surface protein transpeptidase)
VATAPGFLRAVEDRTGPARLRIRSIDVDVEVVPVGVVRAGDMEVPGPSVAGWYRFGPRPGEAGSSVLAAHVDYGGREGAFFRLREVAVGDPVEVAGPGTGSRTFTVTDVAQVPKEGLAAAGAFDRSGPPRLALVTCGGDFDRDRRRYEDNVVVWAEPVA